MNIQIPTVIILLFCLLPMNLMPGERIRQPVFAGSWYPGDRESLEKAVNGYLDRAATVPPKGEIIGLICPHAGYEFSGQVAGYSYRSVMGKKYEVVILIGPSHRYPLRGSSVVTSGVWETPLGSLRIDEETAGTILDFNDGITEDEAAFAKEHSLELQLPFVIVALGNVPIVPIVMGGRDMESVRIVADAVVEALRGKKGLIIASSDLSHYHNGDSADRLDSKLMEHVVDLDVEGLVKGIQSGDFEACGGGPIAAMLMAAKELGADAASILRHSHSGHVTGDFSNVVGYLSAVIFKSEKGEGVHGENRETEFLSVQEQKFLLSVVKETISAKLNKREPVYEKNLSPVLQEEHGVFVTLKKDGRLRGCIGQLQPRGALFDVVRDMALAAAFEDPRFQPVTLPEFDKLEVEISVLTPLEKTENPENIVVGTHGIYMKKGFRSGVLLPQVAVEQKWDREEFLDATCRKAGLQKGCWKDGDTEIYIFRAQVF